ncbi:uncharacterized protein LOC124899490 [Capsicum annuum]|uniref:uncharacterized protein LOC124899490 n=1 Tax=Capsicum annuum TaxID=4072 RepID=UPI001FB0A657|nr:uncharacterized protein LOC124899490 [Capsicum annuum]
MTVVDEDRGGLFFLYGYGGTGKTFIWRSLSSGIRSRGDIVLTVASNGIASILLPGGQTAHSRFVIPLNPTEDATCNIKLERKLVRGTFRRVKRVFRLDLAIGDEKIRSSVDGIEKVRLPNDILIHNYDDPIAAIVESTYPDFLSLSNDIKYL